MCFYTICDLLDITGKRGRPRLEVCPCFPCYLHTHVLVFRYLQMRTHTGQYHKNSTKRIQVPAAGQFKFKKQNKTKNKQTNKKEKQKQKNKNKKETKTFILKDKVYNKKSD